jgi:hypothetical protein
MQVRRTSTSRRRISDLRLPFLIEARTVISMSVSRSELSHRAKCRCHGGTRDTARRSCSEVSIGSGVEEARYEPVRERLAVVRVALDVREEVLNGRTHADRWELAVVVSGGTDTTKLQVYVSMQHIGKNLLNIRSPTSSRAALLHHRRCRTRGVQSTRIRGS